MKSIVTATQPLEKNGNMCFSIVFIQLRQFMHVAKKLTRMFTGTTYAPGLNHEEPK